MQPALAGTALLMGLAGGPHCVAMCSAACAGVIRIVRRPAGGGVPTLRPAVRATPTLAFHAGRIAGYATGGAIAATAVQGLALASEHVMVLRPLWALLHVFVFVWGVVLAVMARQPVWVNRVGGFLAARLRPLAGSTCGVLATGALWISMPCGLLYSALMLAALGNGPLEGAVLMALFAIGSGLSLMLAPLLWQSLRNGKLGPVRKDWGARLAGVLLAGVAVQAVWMDLMHQIDIWCA